MEVSECSLAATNDGRVKLVDHLSPGHVQGTSAPITLEPAHHAGSDVLAPPAQKREREGTTGVSASPKGRRGTIAPRHHVSELAVHG